MKPPFARLIASAVLIPCAAGPMSGCIIETAGGTVRLSPEQQTAKGLILRNAHDPDSVVFLEWWPVKRARDESAAVRVQTKAKSSSGVMRILEYGFVVRHGVVIRQTEGENAGSMWKQFSGDVVP